MTGRQGNQGYDTPPRKPTTHQKPKRMPVLSVSSEELDLLDDALAYYRMCQDDVDNPLDTTAAKIAALSKKVSKKREEVQR